MTPIQKQVIKKLLELSYENGFQFFQLNSLSDLPIETLYDKNTETGELYDISQFGKGYIEILNGKSASINFDLKDQLERWCE